MDKQEIINKFHSVHNEAITSNDVEDMKVASNVFKKTFEHLVNCDMRAAQEIVECYEGTLHYYNFLTETEAITIMSSMVNQDGTKGAKWRDVEELSQKLSDLGARLDCPPYYNKWALFVTINKLHAHYQNVVSRLVGDNKEKCLETYYEMAQSKLKDKTKPYWIRSYYGLGDIS